LNVADLLEPHPLSLALIEAGQEIGLRLNDDCNGAVQEGIGLTQVTQKNGQRHSTAAAFLKPAMQRPNLTVQTHARVTRLLMQDKRVVGVAYIQGDEAHEVSVRREVILCGGAINSPQILMLSGIGPAAHLQALGIPVVMDIPGVGQNLQEHVRIGVDFAVGQYTSFALSSNAIEVNGFIKTRPDLPAPDLQLLGSAGGDSEQPSIGIAIILLRPESQGSITLASPDPFASPLIQPNYLASEMDIQSLVDGFHLARKIGQATVLDAYGTIERTPGVWAQSEEAIRAYIRETAATTFHPVRTCKMGSDPLAVVNDRLQVHGVEGLRVVDASIMPAIVSGNTNAPVIMIGEKGADLIRHSTHN